MAAPKAHDALFKDVFSIPEHAAALLASILPEQAAAALGWSTLALEPGSYVDHGLRQRHSDLLFSARDAGGGPVLIYLLVEHQSRQDPWMPQRMLEYLGRISARWRTDHPRPARLPPVLPIVVHHGRGGWRAARSLADLYALEPTFADAFGPHLPALRMVLYDLAVEPADAITSRRLTDLGKLALLCLKLARRSIDLLVDPARWQHLFAGLLARPGGVRALASILEYIVQTTSVPPREVLALVEERLGERGKEAFMSTAAKQWVEHGRAEGRVEGRAEGQAELLLVQLRARFGAVDPQVVERVRSAPGADLELWATRILSATSVADLFAGGP